MKIHTGLIIFAILVTSCQAAESERVEQTAIIETQVANVLKSMAGTFVAETQTALAHSPTNTVTEIPSPTEDLLQLPQLLETRCIPTGTQRNIADVVNVIDGDTIEVQIDGTTFRVRYIGMDTPEMGTPFSEEAREKNIELIGNRQVLLVKDVSEVDQYGRLLRYVIANDTFVNYELVNRGYAQILTYPPDVACENTFLLAQQSAIAAELGFWKATPTVALPTLAPTVPAAQPTLPPQQGNCHPSYPTVCIPPPPPDLDCGDITYRRFPVTGSDPHRFDGDNDGIGCESG